MCLNLTRLTSDMIALAGHHCQQLCRPGIWPRRRQFAHGLCDVGRRKSPVRIAVFSDVHGNLPALKAVVSSIESSGVDQVICLGDLAFKGPEPGDCVSLIRRMSILVVSGNTDDELCSMSEGGSPHGHPDGPPPASIPYYRWGFCFNVDWYSSVLRSGWWEPVPWEIRARTIDHYPRRATQVAERPTS